MLTMYRPYLPALASLCTSGPVVCQEDCLKGLSPKYLKDISACSL